MHGIGAAQRMRLGELTGVTPDNRRQLDRPGRAPKLVPALLGLCEAISVEVMVPVGSSESCPDLGISQPARDGSVASIPKRDRELRPRLLDEQLHERTGIEVDERHLSDVAR